MAENDTWEKGEDLENAKELVEEFKERLNAEVRWQKNVEAGKEIKKNTRVKK